MEYKMDDTINKAIKSGTIKNQQSSLSYYFKSCIECPDRVRLFFCLVSKLTAQEASEDFLTCNFVALKTYNSNCY